MASTVSGNIGDQEVNLKNAATESTLAALLAIAKQDSAVLRAMASKANVDAKAIEKASQAMEKQNQAAGQAGQGLQGAGQQASLMGGFLLDMGQSVMATGKNLIEFGDQLLDGKAKASDLFKAFSNLPLGLGLLATAFEKAFKFQEKNLDIYRQISSSGAGLNGTLLSLRATAFSTYQDMDEFARTLKGNAETFRALGGSASAGSEQFIAINQKLVRSGMGDTLLGLGYNFEQVNNLLGGYLKVSGDGIKVGKDVNKEQERLAKAAFHYGQELDFISRLTGESREELEKKMQAEAQEASWQLKLASMDEESRQKANDALMRANAMGGKGAMDALKASIMGFAAPFSEEGRNFVSLFGTGAKAIENMAKTVQDGTSAEQASAKLDKLLAQGIAGNIRDMKGLNNVINAMGMGGTDMAKGIMDVVKANTEYIKTGKISAEQIQDAIAQTKKKQAEDARNAEAAANVEKRMKELSHQMTVALLPVIEMLTSTGTQLIRKFTDFIKEVDFNKVAEGVKSFVEGVTKYLSNLFSEEGQSKILNDIKYWFKLLLIELKQALIPWYTEADAEEERRRLDGDKKVIDARAEAAREVEEKARLTKQLELYRDEEKFKIIQEQVKKDKETVENLKKEKELSEAQKKDLADAQQRLKENRGQVEAIEKMTKDQKAAMRAQLESRINSLTDTTSQSDAKGETSGEKKTRERELQRQQMAEEALVMSQQQFDDGTPGTGNILQDFGKGTNAQLHKREAVLNEKQLTNLATGAMDTGSAAAQEKLANAITALNKQQMLTNKILGDIADATKRTADYPYGKWGNAFARV